MVFAKRVRSDDKNGNNYFDDSNFGFTGYVIYQKLVKKQSSCKSCHDSDCPLVKKEDKDR